MRLLNSKSLKLEEFSGDDPPKYAVLSHRWGDEEVSFQEIQNPLPRSKPKNGYNKIKHCAERAVASGLEWIWIDTCCIDKTSSSELSEVINSMYKIYQRAQVCFAYMSDVPYPSSQLEIRFETSKYWTRGWTLQEIIAPRCVEFYSRKWDPIGTRDSKAETIAAFTGISLDVLEGEDPAMESVAQRMSWASRRETTRPEDMAYCLLGIFDINMPLLYGEGGEKAFIRLQEEIMRNSDDQSLFAWRAEDPIDTENFGDQTAHRTGLLASSPARFHGCGGIVPRRRMVRQPYSMTNMGLRIELPLRLHKAPDQYIGVLDCVSTSIQGQSAVGILLVVLPPGAGHLQFARIMPELTPYLDNVSYEEYPLQTILVRQKLWDHRMHSDARWIYIQPAFSSSAVSSTGPYRLVDVWPAERWNKSRRLLRITWREINLREAVGAFWFGRGAKKEFVLIIGYGDTEMREGCAIWCALKRAGYWPSWQVIKNDCVVQHERRYMSAGERHRLEVPGCDWALDLAWDIGDPLGVQAVINVMVWEGLKV